MSVSSLPVKGVFSSNRIVTMGEYAEYELEKWMRRGIPSGPGRKVRRRKPPKPVVDVSTIGRFVKDRPMSTTEPTQDDCRKAYRAALKSFISLLDDIDECTPWSEREPEWWIDMVELRRDLHNRSDEMAPKGRT